MSEHSQTPSAETDAEDPAEDTYEPSTVEATRMRMQGAGMGAKDLAYQRDPHTGDNTLHYGARPDGDAVEATPPEGEAASPTRDRSPQGGGE